MHAIEYCVRRELLLAVYVGQPDIRVHARRDPHMLVSILVALVGQAHQVQQLTHMHVNAPGSCSLLVMPLCPLSSSHSPHR